MSLRTEEAEARIAKAYARCGYRIKRIRVRWQLAFWWNVDAVIVRDGVDYGTFASALTRKRLVRQVEATYDPALSDD